MKGILGSWSDLWRHSEKQVKRGPSKDRLQPRGGGLPHMREGKELVQVVFAMVNGRK